MNKTKPLMISISGVRGIVGETLTPDVVTRFAMAFGTCVEGRRVVVGRDTRPSGPMVLSAVLGGLTAVGCDVVDVGVVATPTCSVAVRELRCAGAVMITASHNPLEWNALKFMGPAGEILQARQSKALLAVYDREKFHMAAWDGVGRLRTDATAHQRHLSRVLRHADVKAIRARRFRVVLDSVNGAGCIATPELLRRLGCRVKKIHCKPDGLFPHGAEPIAGNLRGLCKAVKEFRADIGFAQDPDADRLAIVAEGGKFIGEEYSLALAAEFVLSRRKGPAAANLSSSRMLDDIAAGHGAKVFRAKVGEAHVAECMRANRCVIGGEGNGGVMDPRVHLVRDSFVGIALVLGLMAERRETVTGLVRRFPRYYMEKTKVEVAPAAIRRVLAGVLRAAADGRADRRDGVRVDWPDAWVHVRPSGTEPVMRVVAEARTRKRAKALCEQVLRMARNPRRPVRRPKRG